MASFLNPRPDYTDYIRRWDAGPKLYIKRNHQPHICPELPTLPSTISNHQPYIFPELPALPSTIVTGQPLQPLYPASTIVNGQPLQPLDLASTIVNGQLLQPLDLSSTIFQPNIRPKQPDSSLIPDNVLDLLLQVSDPASTNFNGQSHIRPEQADSSLVPNDVLDFFRQVSDPASLVPGSLPTL